MALIKAKFRTDICDRESGCQKLTEKDDIFDSLISVT